MSQHQQSSKTLFEGFGGSALSLNAGGVSIDQLDSFAEEIKKEMAEVINSVAKYEARKVKEELASNIEKLTKQNDE